MEDSSSDYDMVLKEGLLFKYLVILNLNGKLARTEAFKMDYHKAHIKIYQLSPCTYVDDMALGIQDGCKENAGTILEADLHTVEKHFKKSCLQPNPSKTIEMQITEHRVLGNYSRSQPKSKIPRKHL